MRAPDVKVTSVPVTTTVPPVPFLPFTLTVPPTVTLSPVMSTSPPANVRGTLATHVGGAAPGCTRRATSFCVVTTAPPSAVRKIRPPLLAMPVAVMVRPVLPASA